MKNEIMKKRTMMIALFISSYIFCLQALADDSKLSQDKGTLFLANYNNSLNADYAKGKKELLSGNARIENGELLAKGGEFKPLVYSSAGNISPEEGSIDLVITPEFSLNKPPALTIYRLFKAKGFAAGINNNKNRNYIWFFRSGKETNGKDYGIYALAKLQKNKKCRITIEWNNESMAVFLDGELLKSVKSIGPLNAGDKFMIGGGAKPNSADSLISSIRISKSLVFPIEPKKKTRITSSASSKESPQERESRVIFKEDFDEGGALKNWETKSTLTKTEYALGSQKDGNKFLRANKKDTAGFSVIGTKKIKVKGGKWHRLTADILTEERGPFATFNVIISQFADGKKAKEDAYIFNDGISRTTAFGGINKTPLTMGEWRQTKHFFQTLSNANEIRVAFKLANGQQRMLYDDIKLEEFDSGKPTLDPSLVYSKKINETHAELELEMLTPGCIYEVEAGYRFPDFNARAGKAPGMGITMIALDKFGNKLSKHELIEKYDENCKKAFIMPVPDNAFSILLNMHNSDMIKYNWAQAAKMAKKWENISIKLLSLGEIVKDNALNQYIFSMRPELKPRDLLIPTEFDIQVLNEKLKKSQDSYCRLKKVNGGMCFEIDGSLAPPFFATSHPNNNNLNVYSELAKNGINILSASYPYGGASTSGTWIAEKKYNFKNVDKKIYQTLMQNPNAKIIFSVYSLYAPDWWSDQNIHELACDQNGILCWAYGPTLYKTAFESFDGAKKLREKLQKGCAYLTKGAKAPGHFIQSTASEKYINLISDFLIDLRKHIESMPYGKAVIGYHLHWGYDTQWGKVKNEHGYNGAPHYLDYSKPMLKMFKNYLKNKYKTENALKTAWNNPEASFETVKIPDIKRRNVDVVESQNYFLDPQKDQAIIDYRRCESESLGKMLSAWSKAIKSAGKKDVLTLAYYPDISDSATGGPAEQRGHHVVMNEDSGWDGGGGPSYQARDIGLGGVSNCMLSSFPLHNKIHMCEMDYRVFPVVKRRYCNNVIFDSPRKSLSVLQREFAKEMCYGTGGWLYDMGAGWFNDPMVAEMVGGCLKVFKSVLDKDRSSIAEVAMFIGEHGKNIQGDGRRGKIPKTIVTGAKAAAMHAGLPIDQYQLRDLPLVKNKYKVFYFPFAYAFTEEEKTWINSLKKDGRMLIFGYGAGYVGNSLSVKNAEELAGMRLKDDRSLSLTVNCSGSNAPGGKEFTGYIGAGTDSSLEMGIPKLYVDDSEVESFGSFVNSDKVGVAMKNHGDWQSVYVGSVGLIPPKLLRMLCRRKKLHIYNDADDVMFFCKNLIAIHASSAGEKTIELPEESYVVSLWDKKELGNVKKIIRNMKVGENALYLIERKK